MISIAKRLAKIFDSANVDAVVILNTNVQDSNFTYLTGISGGSFEGSMVIASRTGATLLISPLEYQVAKDKHPKEMKVVCMKSRKQTLGIIKKRLKGKTVGINGGFLPYNQYSRLKRLAQPKRIVDVSGAFSKARQIKDRDEIELIGIANNIVKKAFSKIEKCFEVGVTERFLARKFNELMTEYGADLPSFDTIVCFGANSSVPHHIPGNEKLTKNSFVLIDAGAKYMGYCSDVTRTFIFRPDKGSAKYKRMAKMYDTVKEAQSIALQSMKPGIKCELPHIRAADFINKAHGGKYKGLFIHGLGHSIGIDVHDLGPSLSPGQKEKMREGMVFSDEPGIYVSGFGGVRIEDDVLITKDGAEYL
jgi:Xaa-Pro dipeptidase